jgi:carbon-monoxide dehydrogenase small subunit
MIGPENNILGKMQIRINVNGKDYDLVVAPDRTLLDILRNELHITGTKQGCDDANCGACTVIMDGKAIKSCITLITQAAGRKIQTIEGLSHFEDGKEKLHPIQQAFVDHGAIQCGFCTPGMIMASKALLDENPDADEEAIREGLHGNMCRCTGYVNIVKAVESARDVLKGEK